MVIRNASIAVIILCLAWGITSCSGKKSAVLQDSTCEAPCWRKIEVGKTGIEQAIQLLNQMPDVDHSSIRRGTNPQTLIEGVSAAFIENKESSLRIVAEGGKVVSISFSFDEDISLTHAIKKFGEPEYVFPFALKGDPAVYLTVGFWYPDQGVCLHHQNRNLILKLPEAYRIKGTRNITEIFYVDPSLPQGQIKYGCLTGGDEEEVETKKQEWKGFIEYPIP